MSTLFSLASQKSSWLLERQSLISQNVANANTPGYKTTDAPSFDSVLKNSATTVQLATTNRGHMTIGGGVPYQPVEGDESDIWDGTHSQNTVNLEQEMIKANEVHAGYALDAGIVKSFQGMILASLKG